MSPVSSPVHRRRRRVRPDQGGFALIAVLAAIALTALTIGALFGLLSTTMRVTAAQERATREARAADGAIEAAINQMRTVPCPSPDEDTPVVYLDDQRFDPNGVVGDGDDVTVDVECANLDPSAGSSTTDQVRVVGTDGYQGALRWTVDCAADATAVGCLPWSAALGSVPGGLSGSGTSVVHAGHEPLTFSSGVTVRRGAAALRRDAGGTPAMDVNGQYTQGNPGIGGGVGPCGMLAGDPGAGAGTVADLDDAPVCDSAQARDLDADPTGTVSGLLASSAVPAVPGDCTTPVVSFTPGTYDAAATDAVSRLTDGTLASCRNRTFHFTPGVYEFAGTSLRFGDAGSFYVFGRETTWSTAIGVAGAGFTADDQLCDPAASGTSLVIQGWTSITHTAGRVAICPARPAGAGLDPHPAIYQQTAVPTGVTVTEIIRSLPGNPITLPFSCRVFGVYPTTADYPNGIDGVCRPMRRYELRLATDGQGPVQSLRVMLTGAESRLTPNNLITRRETRFRLFTAAGVEVCSTDFVAGTPNGGLTSSFDVKELPGSCSTTPLLQSQLSGARLVVDHRMDLGLAGVTQRLDISDAEVEVNAVSGRAAKATSSGWTTPANAASPDAAVSSPVMPESCSGFVCQVPDTGRTLDPTDRFSHEITLSDFSFPGLFSSPDPTLDPTLTTLRAVVKVVPSNATLPSAWTSVFGNFLDTENFLFPTDSSIELRSPSGARCIVQGSGMNSDQEIAFDLLDINLEDPNGAGDCNAVVFDSGSDLEDLKLTVRFELPCVPNWFHNVPWECQRSSLFYDATDTSPVWQMRPPDIEHVRLTTVTDTYTGPPPTSTVTIDATDGATGSSFNVAGKAWMPLADLDLNWNGAVTTAPLFGGDLVVHGLGSRMAPTSTDKPVSMGVVCCSPPDSRTVNLVAVVQTARDGREVRADRLFVRAQFNDVDTAGAYDRGFSVDVLEWSSCGFGGCAEVKNARTTPDSPG